MDFVSMCRRREKSRAMFCESGDSALETARGGEWAEPGSNRRHMDFQSIALPAELSARTREILGAARYFARRSACALRAATAAARCGSFPRGLRGGRPSPPLRADAICGTLDMRS